MRYRPQADDTAKPGDLGVTGVAFGTDRRWGHLSIHTETVDASALPDGVMVATTAPSRGSLARTIAEWPHQSR